MKQLPDNEPTRKQRFNAALDLAGMTQEEWRTKYYRVSAQHLNEVLTGERVASAELNAAIDGLISKYLPNAHHRNPRGPQSHCRRGHELTPENVYAWRNSRVCRTCLLARKRRYRIKEVA